MRKFHRERKNRVKKRSRTISLPGHEDYGDGRDADRYFRCWNCGFVCDKERDALGGADSTGGQNYSLWTDVYSSDGSSPIYHGDGENDEVVLAALATIRTGHVIMKSNADGDPATVVFNWYNEGGTGCPLCNTLNWKGDH